MKKSYGLFGLLVLFLTNYSNAQWTSSQLPGTVAGDNVTALTTDGTDLYAAVQGPSSLPAVFRYAGGSWTATDVVTLPSSAEIVTLSKVNANLLAGSQAYGIYYSDDDGSSWQNETPSFPAINALAFAGPYFYAGGSNGASAIVDTSTDGVSWGALTLPGSIGSSAVESLLWSGTLLYVATAGAGVYSYDPSTSIWTSLSTGINGMAATASIFSLAYDGSTYLYAANGGSSIFISSDGGTTWTSGFTGSSYGIYTLSVTSSGNLFAGTGGSGAYYSANHGIAWTQMNSGLENISVNALIEFGGTTYAGLNDGYVASIGDASLPVQVASYKATATEEGVNLTWVTQSEVRNAGFNILRQDPGSSGLRIIASYLGDDSLQGLGTSTTGRAYSYTDTKVQSGETYIYMVQSVSTDGAVGNFGNLSVTVKLPESYALYQNYPNPFNPSTKIRFDLKQGSTVSLEIYNMIGQRVQSWNYGEMSPGRYDEKIDMARFSSGVYFYRIMAQGDNGETFVSTKKLTLVK